MGVKAYQISFGGQPVAESFYRDVVSLTVEESTSAVGSFSLRLVSRLLDDGSWGHLEDRNLKLFTPVTVQTGFISAGGLVGALDSLLGGSNGDNGLHTVFKGYITGFHFQMGGDPRTSFVEVTGQDASVLMSLEEKIASWPNLSDSDIARQIVGGYQIPITADDTAPKHQEDDYTVVQRSTDLQFLRDLARRNGLEFYLESDDTGKVTAYFRAPQLDGAAQADLAAHFSKQTNLKSFSAHMSGLRPLNVKMEQMDIKSKSPNTSKVGSMTLTKLGKKQVDELISVPLGNLITPKDALSQTLVLGPPTSDSTELAAIAQAVRNESAWFIDATGEVNNEAYQGVLRARRTVLVKGAGFAFSGKYYVTKVTHKLRADGSYSQTFEARRNARGVDGTEKFGGNGTGQSTARS
jgi:phage protein D